MRITSSLAACLAALAVVAVVVTALHGQQPNRLAASSVALLPNSSTHHAGYISLAAANTTAAAASGKKAATVHTPLYSAPASRPTIVIGSTQQVLINRDRAAAGLGPLTWSSCLSSVAVSNAVRLSRQGWVPPYHTNGPTLDLGCHLGNQAGENVGYWSGGINDSQLNTMFMNSPEHRANIMGPYHYVATAWAVASNGYGYVAVEFS